jgi:hypothetical protein
MISLKRLVTVLAIVSLLVISIGWTHPTMAASNGQQVKVTYQTILSGCGTTYYVTGVRVRGPNQSGATADWYTSVSNPYCGTGNVVTYGWWWKGSVEITVYYQATGGGSATKTCWRSIPTSYSSDIYPVTC